MTDRSVDGLVLLNGAMLFLIGAANPVLIQAGPRRGSCTSRSSPAIRPHGAYRTCFSWPARSSPLRAWPSFRRATGVDADGARVLTSIAGLVVAIGAVLWIVSLIGRLTVTTDVASAFVAGTGEATPVPAERLMGGLFGAFILLAGLGLGALGVGFLGGPGAANSWLGMRCLWRDHHRWLSRVR